MSDAIPEDVAGVEPVASRQPAGTPADYLKPDWHIHERIHGWRNYISDEVREMWDTFSDAQKAALARNAEDAAGREHWE